jgi:hypothetical protein
MTMNREFWKRVWWYASRGFANVYPDDEPIEVTLDKIDRLVNQLERNRDRARRETP